MTALGCNARTCVERLFSPRFVGGGTKWLQVFSMGLEISFQWSAARSTAVEVRPDGNLVGVGQR